MTYLIYYACYEQSRLHKNEVGSGIEAYKIRKRQIVVQTIQKRGYHIVTQ